MYPFHFKCCWMVLFSFCSIKFCYQTLDTLIRRLIWISTVCICSTKRTLGLYGLRGYCFQKLFLVWNFYCIKNNGFFIKETDTFDHIVLCWGVKCISHIDHFTAKHTAFEQSTACVSVVFALLPGFIPFVIL